MVDPDEDTAIFVILPVKEIELVLFPYNSTETQSNKGASRIYVLGDRKFSAKAPKKPGPLHDLEN